MTQNNRKSKYQDNMVKLQDNNQWHLEILSNVKITQSYVETMR